MVSRFIHVVVYLKISRTDRVTQVIECLPSKQEALSLNQRISSWGPMAHTCYPSYSGGRDQEDWGLKPVQSK
jgi:hypothetical protein